METSGEFLPPSITARIGDAPDQELDAPSSKDFACFSARKEVTSRLRALLNNFAALPDIYKRRKVGAPDVSQELGVYVHDWDELKRRREAEFMPHYGAASALHHSVTFVPMQPQQQQQPAARGGARRRRRGAGGVGAAVRTWREAGKNQGGGSGRTYTSKYRGVHQTFPTRRWEAQFRRSGKPTSLGCFDREEEAARAYDKMMLWCDLHGAAGVKGGITNFDASEYEADLPWLQQVTQDELVQLLRSDGRRQAAARQMKQKRDGPGSSGRGRGTGSVSPELSD